MKDSSKNLIKMRTAAEMIERHDDFRKNYESESFKPVQSIQFSIEAIETYLKYVKSLSRLRGVEVSGIRVVNAIYSADHNEADKCNQQTVLFIPTYRCNNEEVAFDPLYIRNGKPADLKDLLENAGGNTEDKEQDDSKEKIMVMYSMQEQDSSFMNFGSMGKPPL